MARKARKEKRRNGVAEAPKRRRVGTPQDTNLEILPAKMVAIDPEPVSQVPIPTRDAVDC